MPSAPSPAPASVGPARAPARAAVPLRHAAPPAAFSPWVTLLGACTFDLYHGPRPYALWPPPPVHGLSAAAVASACALAFPDSATFSPAETDTTHCFTVQVALARPPLPLTAAAPAATATASRSNGHGNGGSARASVVGDADCDAGLSRCAAARGLRALLERKRDKQSHPQPQSSQPQSSQPQ